MTDQTLHPSLELARTQTRRQFLRSCQVGIGAMALGDMLRRDGYAVTPLPLPGVDPTNPNRPRAPHFAPRAKSVIFLHMSGGPPQHDLFDYKPRLVELNMKPCPDSLLKGQRFAFIKGVPKLLGTPWKFARHGSSGAHLSELLPNIATVADDLCIVKSMWTDQFNHAPAELFLHTGSARAGAASIGAWATYGLGSLNQNLPGFVVLLSGGTDPTAGKSVWGSGFLPSVFQGVQCRSEGEPILYVGNPKGMSRQTRRNSLDALRQLNEYEEKQLGDPETVTRIAQYELAYRMQISVPEVMDIAAEPPEVRGAYGAEPGKASFANNCLLARRLVEQGVRYVQLFDWGWDMHGTGAANDIVSGLPKKTGEIDQPVAALIADLKSRGMLEETLIIWSGEFGRTAMNEERGGSKFLGRDHHPHCFSMFMAGGGVKPGVTVGATDDLGYFVTEDRVPVRDLQATILHLLGLDPFNFAYPYQGLNNRLVGPSDEAELAKLLLA